MVRHCEEQSKLVTSHQMYQHQQLKCHFMGSTTTTLQLINANTATATTSNTTQNMKYVTCIVCVNPIIMSSLQPASTTH